MTGKIFIILLSLMVFSFMNSGCRYTPVPLYLKKEFNTFSRKEKHTGRDLVLTDKLYSVKLIHYRNSIYKNTTPVSRLEDGREIKDTIVTGNLMTRTGFIFFKNGFCVNGLLSDTKENELIYDHSVGSCGFYVLSGDTLKIKLLGRGSLVAGSLSAKEQWYKVSENKLISLVYYKDLIDEHTRPQLSSRDFDSVRFMSSQLQVIENKIKPDSCWLLHQKWFWKHKSEYKSQKK
jgi:hypothetical protein